MTSKTTSRRLKEDPCDTWRRKAYGIDVGRSNDRYMAEWLVKLITTTPWEPRAATKAEKKRYAEASIRLGGRAPENARECAKWRVHLATTEYGVLLGTNMWSDSAGHTGDFSFIPNDPNGCTFLDGPLTLALTTMEAERRNRETCR